MKKFLKNANSGIVCLIELVIGVFLLINPNLFISYVTIIAGAIVAILGVVSLIKYFVAKPEEAEKGALTGALVSLSIGAFLIISNNFITVLSTYITKIIGAVVLYLGYQKLEATVEKIRNKKYFIVSLISALVTILFAVLIIFVIPDSAIWIFIGITLIVESAIDLADMIVSAIKAKVSSDNTAIEAAAEESENTEE